MKKQRKSILSVVLVLTLCMGMVQGVTLRRLWNFSEIPITKIMFTMYPLQL